MSSTNGLKRAELKFSTVNVQEDLQHQKRQKTSRKYVCSSHCLTIHDTAEEVRI